MKITKRKLKVLIESLILESKVNNLNASELSEVLGDIITEIGAEKVKAELTAITEKIGLYSFIKPNSIKVYDYGMILFQISLVDPAKKAAWKKRFFSKKEKKYNKNIKTLVQDKSTLSEYFGDMLKELWEVFEDDIYKAAKGNSKIQDPGAMCFQADIESRKGNNLITDVEIYLGADCFGKKKRKSSHIKKLV
tara:strand:+ start:755 stop:1333 length:579 start_codon:yes stop_codon:yes gene_type:complete